MDRMQRRRCRDMGKRCHLKVSGMCYFIHKSSELMVAGYAILDRFVDPMRFSNKLLESRDFP